MILSNFLRIFNKVESCSKQFDDKNFSLQDRKIEWLVLKVSISGVKILESKNEFIANILSPNTKKTAKVFSWISKLCVKNHAISASLCSAFGDLFKLVKTANLIGNENYEKNFQFFNQNVSDITETLILTTNSKQE